MTDPKKQISSPSLFAGKIPGRDACFDVGRLRTVDNGTASSIIEFIARQRAIPDHVVNAIFLALPLSNPISPSLKKAILFRRLASDLALRFVSEKTLKFLELIEELDRENGGSLPSEAMKAAYCSVALSCTASALRRSPSDFLDSFYRIWVLRISDLEKLSAAALMSEELREVRDILWEAVKHPDFRALVVAVDLEETLDLLRDYLEEVWDMEPLFLKGPIDEIDSDLGAPGEAMDPIEGLPGLKNQTFGCIEHAEFERILMEIGLDVDDEIAEPATVSDSESDSQLNQSKDNNAFKFGYLEDTQKRRDEQVSMSKKASFMSKKFLELSCLKERDENQSRLGTNPLMASLEKVSAIIPDEEKFSTPNNSNSPSLRRTDRMERDQNAFKWTDSSPREGRLHLDSPKRDAVSPLKLIDDKKYAKRRKMKKWTLLEEETLLKAVREHGKGSWKVILMNYPNIFEERTEVDLKDKWRNMTRSNCPS